MLAAGIDLLTHDWQTKRIDTPTYVEAAEPPARHLAQSGRAIDLHRLAVVLIIKASGLRDVGEHVRAVFVEAESLELLDLAADQGDDEALVSMESFARAASPMACGYALERWSKADRLARLVPHVEPELVALAASPMEGVQPPLSFIERGRWWIDDRVWDVRDWIDDRCWALRTAWWRLTEWPDRRDNDIPGAE